MRELLMEGNIENFSGFRSCCTVEVLVPWRNVLRPGWKFLSLMRYCRAAAEAAGGWERPWADVPGIIPAAGFRRQFQSVLAGRLHGQGGHV